MENGIYSSSTFRTDQNAEAHTIQDNLSAVVAATIPSTSNSEAAANAPVQNYSYAGYPTTSDSYGYGNTGYAGYYSGYQQQQQPQQSNQPYMQVAAYQSTGAPQQPISSFQNTVPYAGPANYTTTYCNPPDYQTSGGYNSAAGGYSNQNQNNLWQQGNYTNYANNQYSSYTPEANGAYSSSNPAATPSQYQQHYNQWADYYSRTEVSCAPGTENVSSTGTTNIVHQPAPFNASWGPE